MLIRPPSEAASLILQATFSCSHNKCTFCGAYKGRRFQIKEEKRLFDEIDEMSRRPWRRIFLADGDALIIPQKRLVRIMEQLRRKVPGFERIGLYGNAKSILRKSPEELEKLRDLGLGIVYLGLESGDDAVLERINKGVDSAKMIEAGRRIKEAGIKLSVTVLLGIAGRAGSIAHAEATGKVLTEIDPDFAGALTTMVIPNTPLWDDMQNGDFELIGPFEMLQEMAIMVARTELTGGLFTANHASNYLPLKIQYPHQKENALALIRKVIEKRDESYLKPENMRAL